MNTNLRLTTAAAALALGAVLVGCGADDAGNNGNKAKDTAATAAPSKGGSAEAAPNHPQLKVADAYIPAPAKDTMGAAYLVVHNSGAVADRMVKVTSNLTGETQMHTVKGTKMQQVDGYDVPANGKLVLERGANHIMFVELEKKLQEGDTVELTLHFAKSDPIELEVDVKPMTYRPDGAEDSGKAGDQGMMHGTNMMHGSDSMHDSEK